MGTAEFEEQKGPHLRKRSYYVYTLARPSTDPEYPNEVFYVGKGTKSRVFEHEEEAAKGVQSKKCDVIRDIWAKGGQVQKSILYQSDNEQDALIYEWVLMNMVYASASLTNERSTKPVHVPRPRSKLMPEPNKPKAVQYVILKSKQVRESLGLSQEGLARRTRSLSSRTIRSAEAGQRVTFDNAYQILEAINNIHAEVGRPPITIDDLGLTLV